MLLLLCSLAFAQQPAPTPPQTFSSRSELVLVPVIVHDKSGKHIGGLKQDQFELLDNGKAQVAKVFEEVHTQAITAGPQRAGYQFGNYVQGQSSRRVTIILLDLIDTPFSQQARAFKSVINYLNDHLHEEEPTSLLVLSWRGLRELHSFTTNTRVLIDAVHSVRSELSKDASPNSGARDPYSSFNNETTAEMIGLNQTLTDIGENTATRQFAGFHMKIRVSEITGALENIAHSYAGIPGRKAVVWVSGGFPFPSSDSGSAFDFRRQIERAWKLLNASNVALYPVDVMGLTYPSMVKFNSDGHLIMGVADPRDQPRGVPVPMPELNDRKFDHDTFQLFAEATGGRPCINNNDIADCMERAARDSESYYMLGFYVRLEDRNSGLHKLTVKLNAPHSDLRYRRSYNTTGRPSRADSKQALHSAIISPLDYTDLPVDVMIGDPMPNGLKKRVEVSVSLPPFSMSVDRDENNLTDLDFTAAAFDEGNKNVSQVSQNLRGNLRPETAERLMQQGLTHELLLDLLPGQYHVKCVVYDHLTGKTGSVTARVEIK